MVKKKTVIKLKNNLYLGILLITLLLVISIIILGSLSNPSKEVITSFESCVDSGYLVMESYPRQCRASSGDLFFENLTIPESCTNLFNGQWISEYKECEGITKDSCSLMGGVFNECASACRHESQPKICIMVCIPVCDLSAKL
jgi:hypothetical protein